MAVRKKIYYPDSQITKNLFTYGKEWMTVDDWKEYSGFYHTYMNGEIFTEREWDPSKSRKLVPYKQRSDMYFKYLDLKHYTVINGQKETIRTSGMVQSTQYQAPRAVKVVPSSSDKKNGTMERHFIYKRNEPNKVFFEIDNSQTETYNLDRSGINKFLYGLLTIPWKIEGPEFDIYEGSILKVPGVYDTNKRIIDRYSKKFPILAVVLDNPRQFSKYDK